MNKVTLKYIGNGYRGSDPGNNGAEVLCMNGQDVAVSEVKAVQLLKDYPKNFTRTGATEAADKEPEKKQEIVKPPEATKAAEPVKAPEPEPKPKPAARKPAAKAKPRKR